MKGIYNDLTELIGSTPLLELKHIEKEKNLKARLIAKIEAFNPGGSVKDRVALSMIEDAERRGILRPGGHIIEPTSGNTGIGLAWVASVKGYRITLTMPETMSLERRNLLKALGAGIVLTPGAEGMKGAIQKAGELCDLDDNAVILQQFDNPANTEAHYRHTGMEIWQDTEGRVDMFVAGVGTGGTLSGVARRLKQLKPEVKIVAVEPDTSAVLSGGKPGAHKIQGIGAGFVPGNFDRSVMDRIVPVSYAGAVEAARILASREGLLVGVSAGAALSVAIKEAERDENSGKMIVVLLPDTGERYMSTDLFDSGVIPL